MSTRKLSNSVDKFADEWIFLWKCKVDMICACPLNGVTVQGRKKPPLESSCGRFLSQSSTFQPTVVCALLSA